MPVYIVRNRATKAEVTRYASAQPQPSVWPDPDCEHVEFIDIPYVPERELSHLDIVRRMTPSEQAAVFLAAQQDIRVLVWLENFKLARDLNTHDPMLIEGLGALEQLGLLATGRALEILNG